MHQVHHTLMEEAMFAAGCFWGVEARFRSILGVTDTHVGYAGGSTKDPTSEQVCTGSTGHAEVVHLTFDPGVVSYERLLDIFFGMHDPTTRNRQGLDIGSQYRSAIFYYNEDQKKAACMKKDALEKDRRSRKRKVVTEIGPASEFHRAEECHQQYHEKRGMQGCIWG